MCRNSPNHGAVPPVSISASGENRCVVFEGYVVSRAYVGTTKEALDDKVSDSSSGFTMGDVVQNFVELFQFFSSCFVVDNTSVLAQTKHVKATKGWMNGKGWPCRRGWQLFKIAKEQYVQWSKAVTSLHIWSSHVINRAANMANATEACVVHHRNLV